jgi:sugar phosphate isomerase/epimerase
MLAMTSDFHGVSRFTDEIKNTLSRIVKAGFSHIHWGHESAAYYIYSVHEMLQIREWCNELGLKVKGVHATSGDKTANLKDYSSPNEYNRLAAVELIKNRVDLAHALNGEAIILHSNVRIPWLQAHLKTEEDYKEYFFHTFKTFDELEPYCKTHHIRICIENCGPPEIYLRVFEKFFARYDSDYMGMCFDTGHAYYDCKENCLEYAQCYTDRIFMIHCHDNHRTGDDHIIPFEGGFDWEGFAPILARSPYTLPIVMECLNEKNEDDELWLKKSYEAGSRFSAMVEKYR